MIDMLVARWLKSLRGWEEWKDNLLDPDTTAQEHLNHVRDVIEAHTEALYETGDKTLEYHTLSRLVLAYVNFEAVTTQLIFEANVENALL